MSDPAASPLRSLITDERAYILPMAVFLLLTWAGGWFEGAYAISYVIKTVLVAALLIALRRHYTPIAWRAWGWGLLVGVIGIVQWVGMEKGLLALWPDYPRPTVAPFVPWEAFDQTWAAIGFIAVRMIGAVLVVPVMEELFWRDWLWRTLIAPNDFKLAGIGEREALSFFLIPFAFALVHVQWMTAIVWGFLIAILLVRTRSLGACIIAHAVTNLLLGLYVLYSGEWMFW